MSIISKVRKQDAIYWPAKVKLDRFGQPQHGQPVQFEHKCRWESSNETIINADGTEVTTEAEIFADTREAVKVGDLVLLGTLADLSSLEPPSDAREVIADERTPNFKNTETLRILRI